jgi:hypothetical protein
MLFVQLLSYQELLAVVPRVAAVRVTHSFPKCIYFETSFPALCISRVQTGARMLAFWLAEGKADRGVRLARLCCPPARARSCPSRRPARPRLSQRLPRVRIEYQTADTRSWSSHQVDYSNVNQIRLLNQTFRTFHNTCRFYTPNWSDSIQRFDNDTLTSEGTALAFYLSYDDIQKINLKNANSDVWSIFKNGFPCAVALLPFLLDSSAGVSKANVAKRLQVSLGI